MLTRVAPVMNQVARNFLGFGEAFNAPACYAMITLYFPHSRRATANGIYSTGTYLGSAISSLCLALAGVLGEFGGDGDLGGGAEFCFYSCT